jgi:hypothetical protein
LVTYKSPPTHIRGVHHCERGRPMRGGEQSPSEAHGRRRLHRVCLAAHVSGGLKSHSTCDPRWIAKGGGKASPAGARQVWSTRHGHNGESRTPPRGTWSHLLQDSGGQGARREAGSAGLAENHRVVIEGRHPQDEPVGPRWGMVEPARWRRRHEGSTSSYHGVCGRHGGEDSCVPQGGLVSSKRKVWPRCCDTRRRQGGPTGTTKGDLKPPGGRCG